MSTAALDAIGLRACASLVERGVRLTASVGLRGEASEVRVTDDERTWGFGAGDLATAASCVAHRLGHLDLVGHMKILRYDAGVERTPLDVLMERLDAVEKRLAALERKVPETEAAEPVLCYVDKGRAWFTTQSLSTQWGDDWNDAPYEHNAGDPYSWSERLDGAKGRAQWDLYTFMFSCDGICAPSDFGNYSVEEVNRERALPWVMGKGFALFAGTPMSEFLRVIRAAGGAVTEPVRQSPGQ